MTAREPLLIPGEYNVVTRASRDADALLAAHATPCTKAEARALLAALQVQHGVLNLKVTITTRCRRGRGGVKRKRDYSAVSLGSSPWDAPWGPRVPFVTLPAVPRKLASSTCGNFAGLRVGLVLHEFAHVLRPWDGHNAKFTACLDDLVEWWVNRGGLDAQRAA